MTYLGLRPGEKLYEELLVKTEELDKTEKVFILKCGEIERFVPTVGGHGNTWVEKTFEKYNDIDNKVYDEAKQFIKEVFDIK